MPDVTLNTQLADILRRSTITPTSVLLPEQLERSVYVAVDKALKNAGGKYRKGKGHVFQHGTQFLTDALQTGVVIDRVKKHQFYPTPQTLASDLAMYGHIRPGMRILEPSAGDGAIVRELLKHDDVEIVAIEIRSEEIPGLRRLLPEPHSVREGDFLEIWPKDTGLFDVVVMNPPFTRDQDLVHVQRAYTFLKPGGRLVALTAAGWTYGLHSRKRAQFGAFVNGIKGEYTRLAEQTFGTVKHSPALLFLDKPELTTGQRGMARAQDAFEKLMAV